MDQSDDLRVLACDLIQNAGIQLRVPQVAVSTAQMLLHRVYHTSEYTFEKYNLDITAMAALFLASKIEEYPRRAVELIDVFASVLSSELKCDIRLTMKEQEKALEELFTAEKRLLKTLGFNLLSSHPHKIIISYYESMTYNLDEDGNVWQEQDKQRLLQSAWNYCNDSLRSDIYLRYRKEAIAFACIQMACEDLQMLFPRSTDGREWYQLFLSDGEEVTNAIKMLRRFYLRERLVFSNYKKYLYLKRYQALPMSVQSRRHR